MAIRHGHPSTEHQQRQALSHELGQALQLRAMRLQEPGQHLGSPKKKSCVFLKNIPIYIYIILYYIILYCIIYIHIIRVYIYTIYI